MRKIININDGWTFTKKDATVPVDLPHTWNAEDGQNGGEYYRGECIYSRDLPKYGGKVYLEVNGANVKSAVYINGKFVGEHLNGYGMYRFEITDFLEFEHNMLQIAVDNSPDKELYPATADFTFYGGLYRDVNIICEVDELHFALLDRSRCGVYVSAKADGDVFIRSFTEGSTINAEKIFTVFDADGKQVARTVIAASGDAARLHVDDPVLWNGRKNPYLYTVKCLLVRNGVALDEADVEFGFRNFGFDRSKGFFLNREPLKLKGAARHQDREGKGNALTIKEHEEDIGLLLEMGANSVRLAHYQQSEDMYTLCDRKGLLVWAEIPVISRYSAAKQTQAKLMLEELIRQNYNHPSIYCWGIANEITMVSVDPAMKNGIKELNEIAHKLDPNRPTAMAQVSFLPASSKLNNVTDILGYNHYFGWYLEKTDAIGAWLDDFHKKQPDCRLCLTEYGAEANTALHSAAPAQGDYSEEYQALFHEKYLEEIAKRDWLFGSYVWNMFDFASAQRNEGGVKGRNNKGLVTMDRQTRKDAFWLYKAYWSDESFVRVTGERFRDRKPGTQEIKVYSNCEEVTLTVNGVSQTLEGSKIFRFTAEIKPGENVITASSGEYSHTIAVNGTEEINESYALTDGQKSFVRDYAPVGDDIDPERLSLSDGIGEILGNPEIKTLAESYLGRSVELPEIIGKVPLKPAEKLLGLTKRGKELAGTANRFLQTFKKDN